MDPLRVSSPRAVSTRRNTRAPWEGQHLQAGGGLDRASASALPCGVSAATTNHMFSGVRAGSCAPPREGVDDRVTASNSPSGASASTNWPPRARSGTGPKRVRACPREQVAPARSRVPLEAEFGADAAKGRSGERKAAVQPVDQAAQVDAVRRAGVFTLNLLRGTAGRARPPCLLEARVLNSTSCMGTVGDAAARAALSMHVARTAWRGRGRAPCSRGCGAIRRARGGSQRHARLRGRRSPRASTSSSGTSNTVIALAVETEFVVAHHDAPKRRSVPRSSQRRSWRAPPPRACRAARPSGRRAAPPAARPDSTSAASGSRRSPPAARACAAWRARLGAARPRRSKPRSMR